MTSLYDLPAPAKLNLFLHVIGRRTDGYHLLQSVFVLIDWADTLQIERRSDGLLQRHDLGPALPPEDLCLKAARALQHESGCTLGADISIAKQVPWGAGLGGGSSDAATVLLALNRLWGLGWPRERLLALGARLGADVPFFIGGQTAFVEGIGEKLSPIELPAQRFVVVKPPVAIATQAIFSSPLLIRNSEAATLAGFLGDMQGAAKAGLQHFGRNDLQSAAEAVCPEVSQAARWLEARFGNSRMTGSGSAVFANMPGMTPNMWPGKDGATDPSTAIKPEGDLLGDLPDGWVGRLCRSLQEHPLAGWAG
ncbi:MAG TPA: 4-(cytidine 5'-diphospho)-2-C-methyl-D-erythritol kinase [Ideonella sp.]|nr:4-(cytidine 5'-diphospho)-2-C-methyl-D-erythritol kinase [Ideonella sp.]